MSKIQSVTNLRNWAKWIVAVCQEELDHIGTPHCDGDKAGPEVEDEHFLENAKEHFRDQFGGHAHRNDEFCPFCGLEDGIYAGGSITDPNDISDPDVMMPWAAGFGPEIPATVVLTLEEAETIEQLLNQFVPRPFMKENLRDKLCHS